MIYGEFKQTKEYLNAEDVSVCVNGEDPIEEMYYPTELDQLSVIGCGYCGKELIIDLICENWNERFEIGWIGK